MAHCPDCGESLAEATLSCPRCGADFGPYSAWRPIPGAKRAPYEDDWCRVKGGKRAILFARLAATGGLLFALFTAASFILVFGTLSLPIGLSNSPLKGLLVFALAYLILTLYGFYECWAKPPYTRLVLAIVAVPFLMPLVAPLIALLAWR